MDDGRIQIRSFRVVFQLERRIHRIDRWRIPVPHGVPLRGVAYSAAALAVVVVAAGLPLIGPALRLLPPPLRLVIAPVAIGYLLTQLRPDGRAAHADAVARLRHAGTARRISAFRAVPPSGALAALGELALVPDERSGRYRRALVRGPAQVTLRLPARARARARVLRVDPVPGGPMLRGRVVHLADGQGIEVHG
jgi:hypothetical protein